MLFLQNTWRWIKTSPVAMTFMLSIALSLASLSYRASMNPDGMVHIMAGRIFIEEGFLPALEFFDWPFFSILIGIVSYILPISYETAGHLLNILMLSTTCVLLVKITQRYVPNSAWLACLVVLALPGLNENRHEVMREDGAWMFLTLAIWLAIRNPKELTLISAVGPSVSLFLAFLFRAEFAVFYPALILWQWYSLQENRNLRNSILLFSLPFAATALSAVAAAIFLKESHIQRISIFWSYLNSEFISQNFISKSAQIQQILGPDITQQMAGGEVLAWGMIGYAINSFIENLYLLIIPFAIGIHGCLQHKKKFSLLNLLFISFSAVVVAFLFRHYFLSDRYTATLTIICIPLITYGLRLAYRGRKKFAAYLISALLALNVLDNVISTGDRDTHIVEAGHWLQEHHIPERETYIDFARIAYHAGWVKYNFKFDKPNQARRDAAYSDPKIRYITLWRHSSDDELQWMEGKNLELQAEFTNSKGRKVLILKKPD